MAKEASDAAPTIEYRYLEPKPGNWRRQWWIKGRHMTVGQLVYNMRASGLLEDPKAAALDFDLPVEQVCEALDYYRRYQHLIEHEADEEKRWLEAQGISFDRVD